METEEPEQLQVLYITNLENSFKKNVTKLYGEEVQNKKPAAKNRLIEEPSLNNLNHVFKVCKESGSDVDYIEDSMKAENKKYLKEYNYTDMDEKKEGKKANLLKS